MESLSEEEKKKIEFETISIIGAFYDKIQKIHLQMTLGTVFNMRSAWFLRRVVHYGIRCSPSDGHMISRWPMAGPSVKDHKPAQVVFQCTVLNAKDSTRAVIRGPVFYDDFCLQHLIHFVFTLFYGYFKKHILLYNLTIQVFNNSK